MRKQQPTDAGTHSSERRRSTMDTPEALKKTNRFHGQIETAFRMILFFVFHMAHTVTATLPPPDDCRWTAAYRSTPSNWHNVGTGEPGRQAHQYLSLPEQHVSSMWAQSNPRCQMSTDLRGTASDFCTCREIGESKTAGQRTTKEPPEAEVRTPLCPSTQHTPEGRAARRTDSKLSNSCPRILDERLMTKMAWTSDVDKNI